MLFDLDGDLGQLRDLVAVRRGRNRPLILAEAVPAARAALGPVLDEASDPLLRDELAGRPLVTRLTTGRTAGRRALPPRARPGRILRRRARSVPRALAQALLEPLDACLEAGDLALIASAQLDQELDTGLASRVVDRLGLGALHAKRIRRDPTSTSLCQPHPAPQPAAPRG